MAENYHKELEKISGNHIDVAFVPLDPRLEGMFYLGVNDFMDQVGADRVFPMHFWEDYRVTARLKELPCAQDYRDRIIEITRQGECFEI